MSARLSATRSTGFKTGRRGNVARKEWRVGGLRGRSAIWEVLTGRDPKQAFLGTLIHGSSTMEGSVKYFRSYVLHL